MSRFRGRGGAFERCSLEGAWLSGNIVNSMVDLNRELLELLSEQAAAPASRANTMLRQFRELFRQLTRSAREGVARTPYLLADLGFTQLQRWSGHLFAVRDRETPYAPFFTVPGAARLARRVFFYAWQLASTEESGARLVLCMPPHCSTVMSSLHVHRILELADAHPEWLQPRWVRGVKIWRELLVAAGSGDLLALERAHHHGFCLIEAEARAAALDAHNRGLI